jgi:hypothetical protein
MNHYELKRVTQIAALSALALLSTKSLAVGVGDNTTQGEESPERDHYRHHRIERVIHGVAVTGQNDVRGKPFFSWGDPYGVFHFPTVGIFNPGGPQPFPIDASTPDSALLSTIVDPTFLIVAGATEADIDPSWVNVPLREIPVNTDFALVVKKPLPGTLEAELPIQQSQAEPAGPITLGQWMQANGTARIVCEGDGARVTLDMKQLLPDRMYDVWATLGLPRDGSSDKFFPIPLGGTPNVFITDKHGDALFKRWIKFCPFKPETTNRKLLTINVQYHGNHQNYGAITEPGFIHGLWLGVITFNHVQFPINVDVLPQ